MYLIRKDFSKITVQNLLNEALINRSTFYKHYKDKYDVAEQLCENDMSDFLKTSFKTSINSDISNNEASMTDYLSTLYASLVMTSIKWCLETDNYDELEKKLPHF